MAYKVPRIPDHVWARSDYWLLVGLVIASFVFGGGARDDILSLVVLRPIGAAALVYGLYGLRAEQIRAFRGPLAFMAAVILLILLHLVPLPPAIWSALPGREIAVEAGKIAGIGQPWRPLTLVPWRTWNALYAMLLPAAALILAIRCSGTQRRALVPVILACGLASVGLGMLQQISGFNPIFYPYAISSDQTPTGLFANRNHQAAFIAAVLPLLAAYASQRNAVMGQLGVWVAAAVGSVMFLVLLVTGSRAGLAVGILSLACVAFVYRPAVPNPRYGKFLAWGIIGFIVMLLAVLAAAFLEIGGIERLLNFDADEENRLRTWPVILALIPKYLPFGAGIGSFVEVYMMGEPHQFLGSSYLNHAHSDPLEWALDGGVPAILLMLWAFGFWVHRSVALIRKLPKHQSSDRLPLAASAAILILGLASLVDYPLRVPSLAVVAAIAAVWLTEPPRVRERRADRGEMGSLNAEVGRASL
jgi:O-antigen ligase